MATKYMLKAINALGDIIIQEYPVRINNYSDILVLKIPNLEFGVDGNEEQFLEEIALRFPNKCVILTYEDIEFFELEKVDS